MSDKTMPLVSCLCVTENRPAFMPWLLWCFDRQQWPHRELVIVDGSPQPFQVGKRSDVRVVTALPGTSVARKRNQALQEAQGEIITWFDDDDWQHPQKVSRLVEALRKAPYAGAPRAWFVNLMTHRCARFGSLNQEIIFNSAGFYRESVMQIRFPENVSVASDTHWMRALRRQHHGRVATLDQEDLFFWLCHDKNLSNPARRRCFTESLETLKQRIGMEAWGDTDEALDRLQAQLAGEAHSGRAQANPATRKTLSGPDLKKRQPQVVSAPRLTLDSLAGDRPSVGVMIKATVLDVPYLDTLARHMIEQAHYPFAERTLIIDRPPAFTGKYRDRPRASEEELKRIVSKLLADGVVDRVHEVDMTPQAVQEVMARYFVATGRQAPTHAVSGGPIYATLFGLESMSTDYVLQMDSDVFFYTEPSSWVGQALDCLLRDPTLWLMMTHPGPPAGPSGRSLASNNAKQATWDQELGIWRFRTATTRYFLCDRRRLHQRLLTVLVNGGCAPLEQCISRALQIHGASRGNLGNLQSWHLHGWYHGEPFPAWAPTLAQAVAGGQFPLLQRGEYDLRLDRERDRLAWKHLLEKLSPRASDAEQPSGVHRLSDSSGWAVTTASKVATVGARQALVDSTLPTCEGRGPASTERRLTSGDMAAQRRAPLAIVVPIRDRAGQRLRNALRSLHWQTVGSPMQILIVSHGSQPAINGELDQICQEEGATLLTIGDSGEAWNKPLALNVGIRATTFDAPFLMTLDTDMILAPNFVEEVLACLKREPHSLVLCRSADLPANAVLPDDREQLLAALPQLGRVSQLRGRFGTGGIQATQRSFFFEIRGYDEDLVWWGAMDGDMVNRAQRSGLSVVWIEDRTTMLHQWHPHKQAVLTTRIQVEQARRAWQQNHALVRARAQTLQRNPKGWGGIGDA